MIVCLCETVSDRKVRDVIAAGGGRTVEDILVSEEEHTDWIETQLDLIVRIGLQSYLSEQLGAG